MLMGTPTRLANFVRPSIGMPSSLRHRTPTMQAPASGCQPGRPQASLKAGQVQIIWSRQGLITSDFATATQAIEWQATLSYLGIVFAKPEL